MHVTFSRAMDHMRTGRIQLVLLATGEAKLLLDVGGACNHSIYGSDLTVPLKPPPAPEINIPLGVIAHCYDWRGNHYYICMGFQESTYVHVVATIYVWMEFEIRAKHIPTPQNILRHYHPIINTGRKKLV